MTVQRVLGLAVAGSVLIASPSAAWSPTVHRAVTVKAIDILPKDVKKFYEAHWKEIPSLGEDAKVPDDGPDRRFSIDRLLPFPFTGVPRDEEGFKARFGEQAAIGRLPWLIHESYDRLVKAFQAGDKTAILAASDDLAAVVADVHNPLALTDNADGQKTEQHGLWIRFTSRLAERLIVDQNLKLKPDAAHLLDDPRGHVFSMIGATYVWVDNLLYEEALSRRGKSGYVGPYYDDFAERSRPLVSDRLSRATREAGSYWYTAWSAAGRPVLP